jgi:two-component system, NtrC family, response regulator HydG
MGPDRDGTFDAPFCGLIGRSAPMLALFDTIARVGPCFSVALVTGETGSGKELVAAALHQRSPRAGRPLVPVNCSAIVDTLFESELFGHVRGAFTGATEHRLGLFERANGGVLFLDEVGELPPTMQAKLLRVLETGEVTRVGSSESRRVDVRVIAATNRQLDHEVREGRFRADLFYRLNVVEVRVPALRERRADIPLLVRHFAARFAQRFDRGMIAIDHEMLARLAAQPWPGNVRELRNLIERTAMLGGSTATAHAQAPLPSRRSVDAPSHVRPIADLEREEIVRALVETRGNKKEAARRLGLSRRALYRRLEKFGLASPERAAA